MKLRTLLLVSFLLAVIAREVDATSHVLVENKDGIWLASDTLLVHNYGGTLQPRTICKVVAHRGRLLFNVGYFGNMEEYMTAESKLPIEPSDATIRKLLELMRSQHLNSKRADILATNTGFVQVKNGVFEVFAVGQSEKSHNEVSPITPLLVGVPFGYGTSVNRVQKEAVVDPLLAARIAADPKTELVKILKEETDLRSDEVGPPYTVLLIRRDGMIVDYSDEKVCYIPASARPRVGHQHTHRKPE